MIIGIEAERANNRVKTGVEHYAKQLILQLAEIDTQNTYILYLRTEPEDWFLGLPKNFSVKVMPFPVFWTQLRVSWEMMVHPVDALFIPASALPLVHPKHSIVTIHDLAWEYYPETFTWWNRTFLKYSTMFAVARAKSIIAVSEATKKDLVTLYSVDPQKITVVHHGYEKTEEGNGERARGDVGVPEKYILFLSTIQPRKNLDGLITAFVQLKKEYPEIVQKLVVVGRPGWKFESTLKHMEDHASIITYLNHVSDGDRFKILAHADLLVLPSFYEGFGMQILEAFDAGVPVVTSNISSMPEVAGDAAVYFDPHKTDEIKQAIKNVLMDRSLAHTLQEKGTARLARFGWKKCAEETLEVLARN